MFCILRAQMSVSLEQYFHITAWEGDERNLVQGLSLSVDVFLCCPYVHLGLSSFRPTTESASTFLGPVCLPCDTSLF